MLALIAHLLYNQCKRCLKKYFVSFFKVSFDYSCILGYHKFTQSMSDLYALHFF